jgi:hypothetical protein
MVNKEIENILNEDLIKRNLATASLFLLSYEALKSSIEDRLIGFFSLGECYLDEKGGFHFRQSDHFKEMVIHKYASEVNGNESYRLFESCRLWLLENEVIDEKDSEMITKIRRQRNTIAHEMVKILFENQIEMNVNLVKEIIKLVEKIDYWWFFNVEKDCVEEFDGVNLKHEDVDTGMKTLLEYFAKIIELETGEHENS